MKGNGKNQRKAKIEFSFDFLSVKYAKDGTLETATPPLESSGVNSWYYIGNNEKETQHQDCNMTLTTSENSQEAKTSFSQKPLLKAVLLAIGLIGLVLIGIFSVNNAATAIDAISKLLSLLF